MLFLLFFFIVKCRSTSHNYNDLSNPSISLPSLRGRGRGWGVWGFCFYFFFSTFFSTFTTSTVKMSVE